MCGMEHKDFRKLTPAAQEQIRKKTVNAVCSGMKQKQAAELFGVTEQTVCHWMKAYRKKGEKGLRAGKRGRPHKIRLEPWQAAQTVRAIEDRHPEQLKLPFYLWTRKAVAELIERRFAVRLSVWTVGRYLKRWGFTPQKPLRRAYEQNPKEVERWLKEEYPAIRDSARRERGEIYWGDEMGLRSDHQTGRSYGRKGETPVRPGTGRRFGCNMISAITNKGKLGFMVFKTRFNTPVFIEFLGRLIRHAEKKVFLIVDRHPVHLSSAVRRWIEARQKSLRLFFLPPFSPELNPDEILNQDVKTNSLGRRRPGAQGQMISDVRGYLRSRQRNPQIVRNYFHEKHVRYASAES